MTDLVTFLRDRIEEDRASAELCIRRNRSGEVTSWHPYRHQTNVCVLPAGCVAVPAPGFLTECEAKRQIVDLVPFPIPHYQDPLREWESCPKVRDAGYCEGTDLECGPGAPCECGADQANAEGGPMVLRLLALPYADHAAYQEEWRP